MEISKQGLQAFLRGSLQPAVVKVEAFHEPVQNLHGFRPQQDLLTALLYRRQEPELVVNNHFKQSHVKNTPYNMQYFNTHSSNENFNLNFCWFQNLPVTKIWQSDNLAIILRSIK